MCRWRRSTSGTRSSNPPNADFHRVVSIPNADSLDDRHLLKEIRRLKPDVIAATLYLWNIERTLVLLEQARAFLPRLKVIAGGPEVAADHPFLFRNSVVDVAVSGEGENVFPEILKAFRTGRRFVRGRETAALRSANLPAAAFLSLSSSPTRTAWRTWKRRAAVPCAVPTAVTAIGGAP